jgi:hypothetical protein
VTKSIWVIIITSVLVCSRSAQAQEIVSTSVPENAPARPPCLQPATLSAANDDSGRIKKIEAFISIEVEQGVVDLSHDGKGATICPLTPRARFSLFTSDLVNPVTFATIGLSAGWSQFLNQYPTLGQGTKGFAKRYEIAAADRVSAEFMTKFLFPSLLHEDPLYYRMGHGPVKNRLGHAMSRGFIGRRNSGRTTFNFSEFAGLASSAALQSLYHPSPANGFQPAARAAGFNFALDVGTDIFREFWPELSRKLRFPSVSRDYRSIPQN